MVTVRRRGRRAGAALRGGSEWRGSSIAFLGSASGLAVSPAWNVESNETSLQMGSAIAGGDVNGDGFTDVIVGSEAAGAGGVLIAPRSPGGPSTL